MVELQGDEVWGIDGLISILPRPMSVVDMDQSLAGPEAAV